MSYSIIKKISISFLFCLSIVIQGCLQEESNLKDASKAYKSGDYKRAAEIFIPEAKKGNPEALVNIAFMHYCGLHVKQNYELAAKYYMQAAELNNVNAQFSLGTMYENGEGVNQDKEKAYFWYLIAENNGDEDAKQLRISLSSEMTEDNIKQVEKEMNAWYAKKQNK